MTQASAGPKACRKVLTVARVISRSLVTLVVLRLVTVAVLASR